MIAKFIGSASEFASAKYAMMVYSVNSVLSASNIDKYTSTYSEFVATKTVLTEVDESGIYNNKRIAKFTTSDIGEIYSSSADDQVPGSFTKIYRDHAGNFDHCPVEPTFNYIILMNVFSRPIGYINLLQEIEFKKYGIQSVTLVLDFDIVIAGNEYLDLKVDTKYRNHLINSSINKAHGNQFEVINDNRKVATPLEIKGSSYDRLEFTRTIQDAIQNSDTILRYSGKFAYQFNQISVIEFQVSVDEFNKAVYYEYLVRNGVHYLVLLESSSATIIRYKNNFKKVKVWNLGVRSSLDFGSNIFIIRSDQLGTSIYSTEELLDVIDNCDGDVYLSDLSPIRSYNGYSDFNTPSEVEDWTKYEFAKNPDTKELYFYRFDGKTLDCDKFINNQLELWGVPNLDLNEAIYYVSDNMICIGQYQDDRDYITSLKVYNPPYYSVKHPKFLWNKYKQDSDLNWYYGGTDIRGIDISDVQFLSPTMMYIEDVNRSLASGTSHVTYQYLQNSVDDTEDPMTYQKESTVDFIDYTKSAIGLQDLDPIRSIIKMDPSDQYIKYTLSNVGCANYHLIAKLLDSNLHKITPMRLQSDGSLFGYYQVDSKTIIIRKM